MVSTLTPRRNGSAPPTPTTAPKTPVRRRRAGRNDLRIGGGVVVIVLCVLAFATLYSHAGERATVITIARDVPAGHTLTADDLSTTLISTDVAIPVMPASKADSVVGRTAATDLVSGSLLTAGQLRDGPRVATDRAVVGAKLQPGQYPTNLRVGDNVQLVAVPAAGASPDDAKVTDLGRGRVVDLVTGGTTGDVATVSIDVPQGQANEIAGAGSAARLSLAVVGS